MKNIAQKGTEGIQILAEQVVNLSVGTLASRTALLLADDFATALNEPFLLKKVRMVATHGNMTAGDNGKIIIAMARGTVSVASIKSAMENPAFLRNKKEQAIKRDVLFETITPMGIESFDGTEAFFDSGMISVGGGKGIPFDEDLGWQWFIWNFSNGAFQTGSVFNLHVTYWGIWL